MFNLFEILWVAGINSRVIDTNFFFWIRFIFELWREGDFLILTNLVGEKGRENLGEQQKLRENFKSSKANNDFWLNYQKSKSSIHWKNPINLKSMTYYKKFLEEKLKNYVLKIDEILTVFHRIFKIKLKFSSKFLKFIQKCNF